MNSKTLFLALVFSAVTISLRAVGPDAPMSMPSTPAGQVPPAGADVIPSVNYPPTRYEALWTKSPFAVATPEDAVQASPDYMLVGIANVGGVFYASVIERDNQEHFLISSDKLVRGMTLKSINRSPDGQDTYASVIKDNQPLTLKLEAAPGALAGGAQPMPGVNLPSGSPAPGIIAPQISMPGATPAFNGGGGTRPFPRMHRPQINLPPRMQQQQQAVPQPMQNGQAAPPPPH